MRTLIVIVALALAGCGQGREPRPSPSYGRDTASGEVRARIAPRGEAAATMRSGTQVPVSLPPGFTLYPGAKVLSNTLVERDGRQRVLLAFETPDRLAKVMLFYRYQAEAADATVLLDLGGEERASLGGRLASGREFAISARRNGAQTRVEWSVG